MSFCAGWAVRYFTNLIGLDPTRSVNVLDFYLRHHSSCPFLASLSLSYPLSSHVLFRASYNPSRVIPPSTRSLSPRLPRSFCLRISVFHNSLSSLTPSTFPSLVVPKLTTRFLILWHRTLFSPLYPYLTCERFTWHVTVIDFQNNNPRKWLESVCTGKQTLSRGPWRAFRPRGQIDENMRYTYTVHINSDSTQ